MNYIKKLGEQTTKNNKFFYEGLAYELENKNTIPLKQIVNKRVDLELNNNLLKKHGIKLDNSLLQFYSQIKFVKLFWELENSPSVKLTFSDEDERRYGEAYKTVVKAFSAGKLLLRGRMNIFSLEDLLEGPDKDNWHDRLWFDSMDEKKKKFWKKFMIFDFSISECLILLKKDKGVIRDNLFYYYISNDEPTDMKMGIDKYLDIACKVKVFDGWQFALMREPLNRGLTLKRMKAYLPQIFPKTNFDFSDFE